LVVVFGDVSTPALAQAAPEPRIGGVVFNNVAFGFLASAMTVLLVSGGFQRGAHWLQCSPVPLNQERDSRAFADRGPRQPFVLAGSGEPALMRTPTKHEKGNTYD